jgi:hypothetical protein
MSLVVPNNNATASGTAKNAATRACGAADLRRIAADLFRDVTPAPRLQADLTSGRTLAGHLFGWMGDLTRGLVAYCKALAIRQELVDVKPGHDWRVVGVVTPAIPAHPPGRALTAPIAPSIRRGRRAACLSLSRYRRRSGQPRPAFRSPQIRWSEPCSTPSRTKVGPPDPPCRPPRGGSACTEPETRPIRSPPAVPVVDGLCGDWSAPAIVGPLGGLTALASIPAALVRVVGRFRLRVHAGHRLPRRPAG